MGRVLSRVTGRGGGVAQGGFVVKTVDGTAQATRVGFSALIPSEAAAGLAARTMARRSLSKQGIEASRENLAIPTWHYGHEPPNPFATDIAKYFKNAIREDILLHVATAGVVFVLYRREFHSDVLEVMAYSPAPLGEPARDRMECWVSLSSWA